MHIFNCTATVRFTDEDVIDNLLIYDVITGEEAQDYKPTREQLEEYAWCLLENDEAEYSTMEEQRW